MKESCSKKKSVAPCPYAEVHDKASTSLVQSALPLVVEELEELHRIKSEIKEKIYAKEEEMMENLIKIGKSFDIDISGYRYLSFWPNTDFSFRCEHKDRPMVHQDDCMYIRLPVKRMKTGTLTKRNFRDIFEKRSRCPKEEANGI